MDCGATCLRIIGRFYGRAFPINYLRGLTYTNRLGATLEGISKGAESIGFRCLAVKVPVEKFLEEAPLPAIVHWNQNHFVVVYKFSKRKVYISDPGRGLIQYSKEEFSRQWSSAPGTMSGLETPNLLGLQPEGVALLIEPTPALYNITIPDGTESKINVQAFLGHYLRPHKRLLLQVCLSLVAASILQLIVPFLTRSIVDTGIYKKDIPFIWLILIAQLSLTLGSMTLELIRGWMILHISSRINISLISDFFLKLMKLPIRYFDTRLSGDLMQRIADHQRIEGFLTNTTLNALFAIFTLLLYSVVLLTYSISLFVIFIAGSAAYLCWILFFLRRRAKLDHRRFQKAGDTQSKVFELINGMQEIKLHNAELQKRWSWERIQVKLFHISVQSLSLEQAQSSGSRIINELKNIFVSITSAKLVIDGQITLGTMLAVSYIIGQLNGPILQLVGVIKSWQDAQISLERIAEIHGKDDEVSIKAPQEDIINVSQTASDNNLNSQLLPLPKDHNIVLQDVSFAYDALSPAVLKNITLNIPKGKVTAVVGPSGSGKTTLLKLLMRFYEPTNGKAYLGTTELNKTDLAAWRSHCGVVMQEGFIFNDSIAGNIAIGQDAPNVMRLIEAARIANVLDFIEELPLGFNTKIGVEGLGISTGQKQRILIARAVYKNPSILFFDEATSSLDANNERRIMGHLEEFYRGKTVIIIAHRLSTVRHADNIVVLDGGKIVEEGCHDELTFRRGAYYELVKNQLELGN
jgi:ATP-binding cassette subfamily B protein